MFRINGDNRVPAYRTTTVRGGEDRRGSIIVKQQKTAVQAVPVWRNCNMGSRSRTGNGS
jgi:hypothetical protein